MERLFLPETDFTPELILDLNSKSFSLSGVSRPENVVHFYQPAINWLKELISDLELDPKLKYELNSIDLIFKLSYFNSASFKMLLHFLEMIRNIKDLGIGFNIQWFYDETDDQMKEDGEDLADATGLQFEFIPA